MSRWFQPYTANKTVTTTYVYVQQVGGQPGQQVQYVPQGQQTTAPGQQVYQVQHVPQHPGVVMQPIQQHVQHYVGPMLQARPVHYQQPQMRPPRQHLSQVQQLSPHVHAQQPVNQAYQGRPPAQQHYQVAAAAPPLHYAYPPTALPTPHNLYQSAPSTPYMEHAPPAYTPPELHPTNPPTHSYYHEKPLTQASSDSSVLASLLNPHEKNKPILPIPVETVYAARTPMPGPTFYQKQNSAGATEKDNQAQQHLNKHNSTSAIQRDNHTQQHMNSASRSRNPQAIPAPTRNPQTFDDNLSSSSTSSSARSSAPYVVSTSFRTVQLDTRANSGYSSALSSSSSTRPNSASVASSTVARSGIRSQTLSANRRANTDRCSTPSTAPHTVL